MVIMAPEAGIEPAMQLSAWLTAKWVYQFSYSGITF